MTPQPRPSRSPTSAHSLLDLLTATGQVRDVLTVEARPEQLAQWPPWVPAPVLSALVNAGIERPWVHQAQAAEALHKGRHTVLASGTGSGKSLAVWVPALSRLIETASAPTSLANRTHRPTFLYLSPTKALAADQLTSLRSLALAVDSSITVGQCDGDSLPEEKSWARTHADIVLSNPDYVHHAMLARSERWERLWRGLNILVIDEFHHYRGTFGAHVALVARRILRLARRYGATPAVAFLSATSADPREAAQRFLGSAFGQVEAVEVDGSPRGARSIVLWEARELTAGYGSPLFSEEATSAGHSTCEQELYNGQAHGEPASATQAGIQAGRQTTVPPVDPLTGLPVDMNDPLVDMNDPLVALATADAQSDREDAQSRTLAAIVAEGAATRSANTEAGELTGILVEAGAKVLTFVRSRPGTEVVAAIAQRYLEKHPYLGNRSVRAVPQESSSSVLAYRGGYLPEERRELEARLRSGELRALATTNALELGIDISGLDAVVLTGWPGTHASFAQQTGRAGRAGGEGLAVLLARDNPLDHYMLDHPSEILEATEVSVFDPSNPNILTPHLCTAAAEQPLTEADLAVFGLPSDELLRELEAQGLLKRRPRGWFWNTSLGVSPHSLVSLRGEDATVPIVRADTGAVLGTVDSARADWTVHPGAIYLHQGARFEVESFDGEVALVRPHEGVPIMTFANDEMNIEIEQVREQRDFGSATWCFGDVVVWSRVVSYDVRREGDGMYLGTVGLEMPLHELHTQAVWWTLSEQACRKAGLGFQELPGALHAAEHTMIGILPLLATCDRWDVGGLSTALHAGTGEPTVFVHDAVTGGSGCARRGFEAGSAWLSATLERIENCECEAGCPRCIQSPKCGNANSPLDKAGAATLLHTLLAS